MAPCAYAWRPRQARTDHMHEYNLLRKLSRIGSEAGFGVVHPYRSVKLAYCCEKLAFTGPLILIDSFAVGYICPNE